MSYPVMPLGFLGSQGDQDTYQIQRSLRFNSADSAYLNRTPASAGTAGTWTFSFWIKRSTLSSDQVIYYSGALNQRGGITFTSGDIINILPFNSTGANASWQSTMLFRDTSSWYHITIRCFSSSSSNSYGGLECALYVNGVEQTFLKTLVGSPTGGDRINDSQVKHIGQYTPNGQGSYLSAYLAEFYFIDGQALTPSSFGETDAITGRWKAKAYSGTYGTNGFYLKFADNSGTTATTLGKDSSGNGNNWTPNNFSVTAGAGNDSLVDSPTNYGTDSGVGGEVRGNYATLNAVDNGGVSLLNGNLDANINATRGVRCTIGISSGKYYFEMTVQGFGVNGPAVGVAYPNANISSNYAGSDANAWVYNGGDGKIYNNNAGTGSNASYTTNDIIGVAVNMDNGTVTFYKNNSAQPTTVSGLSGTVFPVVTSGGTAGIQNLNFGQRPFAYTAPSGFKALCTTNLPQPTIQKPSSYMDVVTYTGNGSTQTISSLGFSPDFLWSKSRSVGRAHRLIDSVRGIDNVLVSDTTAAEYTGSAISSFNSNGFSLKNADNYNINSETYVAWAWDEAPIAGMDIVSYTGTGVARTIAHNLGVAPKMMIVKNRNPSVNQGEWMVYHSSLSASGAVFLNLTNAYQASSTYWNNTAPTSSVFTVGTNGTVNENTKDFIAYLFAEVEGFSRFGSYTGNGSADGPFVWCGFRPRWVMIKMSSSTGDWYLFDTARDTFNATQLGLIANSSQADGTYTGWGDITSNGFKIRRTDAAWNTSGGTYIFAAFAETAFRYARAR